MGADYYQADRRASQGISGDAPPLGIGRQCIIKRAIVDKNVRIGDGVVITPEGKPDTFDDPEGRFFIRDGIVVVPKGAIFPTGTRVLGRKGADLA